MLSKQFKHILKEQGANLTIGHYPTSDEVNTMPQISSVHEWGCQIELSDGVIVECTITPFTENMVYASFHRDGSDAEIFEVDAKKLNKIFKEFKKRIEEKYDQKFLNEKDAKSKFETYLERVFI